MIEIKVRETYGVYDISDLEIVEDLIKKVDFKRSPEIVLNFQHCMLDYPSTAKFIDYALQHLLGLNEGKRKLIILTRFDNLPEVVLNSLFLGSKNLGFEKSFDFLELNEIHNAIEDKLINNGIVLEINLINFHGEFQKKYYG